MDKSINFHCIKIVNGAPADAEGFAVGCQGFLLIGDGFTEIHTIGFGFDEHNEHYILVNKTVASTSDESEAMLITKGLLMIGDVGTEPQIDVSNLGLQISSIKGKSLDLLSSSKHDREITLNDYAIALFTVRGARIQITCHDGRGAPLKLRLDLTNSGDTNSGDTILN